MSSTWAHDDQLGARVATALARRTVTLPTLDLELVRRGARRRAARRRAAVGVSCVALLVGAATLLAVRLQPSEPLSPPPELPPPPPSEDSDELRGAVLPIEYGEPTAAYAELGGRPRGAALPAVDVWEAGDQRIIVRTFADLDTAPSATVAAQPSVPEATAAPAPGSPYQSTVGEIDQLSATEWVKYFTDRGIDGDLAIARGMTRAEAEGWFAVLDASDGPVRQPGDPFQLVEHVDASPADTPAGWYTNVGHGPPVPGVWTSVWSVDAEYRSSIELGAFGVGSVRTIAGRTVYQDLTDRTDGWALYIWLDGDVAIGVYGIGVDETTVADLALISQSQLEGIAADVSSRLAALPVVAETVLDGLELSVRGDDESVALCIAGSDDGPQCATTPDWSLSNPPVGGTIDAVIDGEWVIAGIYQLGYDESYRPNFADDRFVTPAGDALPVQTGDEDGFLWYVVRVPAGVDVVDVGWSNETAGVVGPVARPLLVGQLG